MGIEGISLKTITHFGARGKSVRLFCFAAKFMWQVCTRAFSGSLFCSQNSLTDLSSRRLSTSRSVARSSSWSSWGSNTYFQNHDFTKHCQTILAWIDGWNDWICYDCLREGHSLDLAVRFNQWKITRKFRWEKWENEKNAPTRSSEVGTLETKFESLEGVAGKPSNPFLK